MKKLLLLDNRMDTYGNLMWSVAIKNGWKTFRMVASDDLGEVTKEYDYVRFYANTLIAEYLRNPPFKFYEIPRDFCAKVWSIFPEYAGREIISMQFKDLIQPITEDKFVKPAYQKYFEAKVYKAGEVIGNEVCKPEDYIYVQDIIEPVNEVRCFVLNGEILTASYYKINKEFNPYWMAEIPNGIKIMVRDICERLDLKWGIVLDFAQFGDSKEWFFLEANEAWASGLYDCDPIKCLECVDGSQY